MTCLEPGCRNATVTQAHCLCRDHTQSDIEFWWMQRLLLECVSFEDAAEVWRWIVSQFHRLGASEWWSIRETKAGVKARIEAVGEYRTAVERAV